MQREHSIFELEGNEYQRLLPEIAEMLNVSVSTLETYPVDMQIFLCQTYINNYNLSDEAAKQALYSVINLEPTENRQIAEPQQQEHAKKVSQEEKQANSLPSCDTKSQENKTFFISRKQILQNVKVIESNKQKEVLQNIVVTQQRENESNS